MNKTKNLLLAIVSSTAFMHTTFLRAQDLDSCAAVYAGNLVNLDVSRKVSVQNSIAYSKYCNANGSVNQSSVGVNVSAIVYSIPFTVGLTNASDEEKMETFCKTGFTQNGFFEEEDRSTRDIVVSAENNFNECRALELAGLTLIHAYTPPRFVTIQGLFHVENPSASIQSISYDSTRVRCNSASFGNGQRQSVGPTSPAIQVKHSFSISCERIPIKYQDKDYYPDAQIVLSVLSSGVTAPYEISLPADDNYGPALASDAQSKVNALIVQNNALTADRDKMQAARDAVQARLDRAGIAASFGFFIGSDDQRFDYNQHFGCGTDPDQVAADWCKEHAPGTTAQVWRSGRARPVGQGVGGAYCTVGNHPEAPSAWIGDLYFVATCLQK